MKRTILLTLVLVATCAVCSWIAYDTGYAHARRQSQKGTFVRTMGALGKLRAADVAAATDRIEALCFMSAISIYDTSERQDESATQVARMFASELIQYRANYRTNRAEWTPVEQKLETILASWR
jgi:hypothetical protein